MKPKLNPRSIRPGSSIMSRVHQLSTIIHQLANRACGLRALRLHPKFRWLSYACPILDRTGALKSERKTLNPPDGPPRLRLRKRRLIVRKS